MQDATKKQNQKRKEEYRPEYDQTAIYEELLQEELEYIWLESQLRGISQALYELGLDSVDDSGDDLGDSLYCL